MDKYLIKTREEKGITLVALAVTIIVLLILSGTAINLTLGEDGIFRKAIESADRYKAEAIKEQIEMIKVNTVIDNNGEFNIDDFFDNLVEEGIVGGREEIIDNGDGSHTITTDEGYVIDIIEKDDGKDVEIEYVGKGEAVGPRIKEIIVKSKTTSTIEIEVETINGKGAKYTYSYRKNGEGEYIEAEKEIEENKYTFEGLEANKLYDIKVGVENRGIKVNKEISVYTGELPEGAITIGEVEWKEGKAEVVVNINKEIEGNLRLEYKINEEGIWTEIQDGEKIENLEHNQTVYVRLTDGTNETEYLSTKIEDNIAPEVSISLGTITSSSIAVTVTASDSQTGLADTNTYEYFLNGASKGKSTSNTYTFSNLSKGTYTLKVKVQDKAGNEKEAEVQGTTETVTSGLEEGAITFTNPVWSGGTASIKVSTNTSYQIEYQKNGTTGSWIAIESGETISGLAHNTTVYARLTDGINAGEYASTSIKDTTAPTVSIKTGIITSSSIAVTVTASDSQTGLADTNTYEYFLNGTSQGKSTSNTHTFSNLSKGTYTLKVKVQDKAGNSKEAQVEGTTQTVTSGTTTGAITFTSPTWSRGTASIKVSTNTSYQIEYQKNGTTGSWTKIASGGTISGLSHNQAVYARLTDGINAGEYASTSIKDTIAPTVNIKTGTITSSSIAVTVTASDSQTGLADTNTYEYFLNGTSQGKSTSNTHTFSNLSKGTYTLKVKVQDKAGNSKEAQVEGTTQTVTSGTTTGAITFTSPTWSGGKASIKVSTNTSYQIEYQKNGTTGSWTKIASGGTISGLAHNTTVYARLTDGINAGEYASTSIKDTTAPTVSISTSNITSNSIRLNVTASDAQSGLASSGAYSYYLNNGLKVSNNTNYYNYTGLTPNTSYTLKVIVKDKAGKTTEKTTTIKTISELEEAITSGKTYTSNTTIYDSYNNPVKIPAGFKIATDSGKNVTEGVVIEDVSAGDGNTKGNQYVWVPIGNVRYNTSGAYKTINFGRYDFESNSAGELKQSADNYTNTVTIESLFQELQSSSYGNTVSKNLGDFITKTKNAGGYYIGRYEAGKVSGNTNTFNVKKGQTVYNNVTQPRAATLARNLYSSNSNFQSDLINSYAWDTAIVFIQTFSGDPDYSKQRPLQYSLTTTGNAHSGTTYDVRCNIYDMAGNVKEWSTERCTVSSSPCVYRGGSYDSGYDYTAGRYYNPTSHSSTNLGFRSTLYL